MKHLLKSVVAALALCAAFAFAQFNGQVQALPAGAYTATTVTGATQINQSWTSAQVIINVTSYSSGNYTPHIQGIDRDGTAYDILVGSAISSTGTTVLHIGAGVLALPNVSAQTILPIRWRVQLIGASSPSMSVVVNANMGL